jgi:hypothetical protein
MAGCAEIMRTKKRAIASHCATDNTRAQRAERSALHSARASRRTSLRHCDATQQHFEGEGSGRGPTSGRPLPHRSVCPLPFRLPDALLLATETTHCGTRAAQHTFTEVSSRSERRQGVVGIVTLMQSWPTSVLTMTTTQTCNARESTSRRVCDEK